MVTALPHRFIICRNAASLCTGGGYFFLPLMIRCFQVIIKVAGCKAPGLPFATGIAGYLSGFAAIPFYFACACQNIEKNSNTVSRAPNAEAPEDTSKTPHAATGVAAINNIAHKQGSVNTRTYKRRISGVQPDLQ